MSSGSNDNTNDSGESAARRTGHAAGHLPGTDAEEWLEKRREAPSSMIGAEEGEIHVRLSKGEQSARQVRNGKWVDIPVEEALRLAKERVA